MHTKKRLVGLFPAAGQATRISPLPCSKEVVPIGVDETTDFPIVICQNLLRSMELAGVEEVYVILREGKWDIPAFLCGVEFERLRFAYLVLKFSSGTPFTLDFAYPFVKESNVALGFPDIIFSPDDAFLQMREKLDRQIDTEIVLGVFPASIPQYADMVNVDENGRVTNIEIKPKQTALHYAWILAIWTPIFTRFIHEYLAGYEPNKTLSGREIYVGDILQAAIETGWAIDTVVFDEGKYVDIGTPSDLRRVMRANPIEG